MGIPRDRDLTSSQWFAIERELRVLSHGLEQELLETAKRDEPILSPTERRHLDAVLGDLELRTARAYGFFDTFMDVLTQRLAPQLGLLLKGCDVLARDALGVAHPALRLSAEPVVYLNRGFGAAIVRSDTVLAEVGRNPLPLVQLPYARLQEKHNLASLLHEIGHEAIVRLRVRKRLVKAMHRALDGRTTAPVRDRLARWTLELAPDFWAFGCVGAAQAATARDVLSIPPDLAMADSPGPHPPAYLRALMSFHWCRHAYGRGPWDDWELEWRARHRRRDANASTRALLAEAERVIALASDVFFRTKLEPLDGRALVELFDLEAVAPTALALSLRGETTDSERFLAMRPVHQLAVFRLLHERERISAARLDESMTQWLFRLAMGRRPPRGES